MKNMKTANQEYRKECMDSFSKEFWKSEAIRLEKEATEAYISGQIAGLRKVKDDFATPKSQKEIQETIEPYIRQALREFADEAGECDADNAWKRLPNGNAKIKHLVEWSMLRKRWGI